jgi:hypothetical protein
MAQCAFWKMETQLLESGIARCVPCATETLATRDLRASLVRDLLEASALADSSSMELRAIISDIPAGIPHPTAIRSIQNASERVRAARRDMTKAQSRLNDLAKAATGGKA